MMTPRKAIYASKVLSS